MFSALQSELPNQSDTSNAIILVSLLNPKFANALAARYCELRVRDTRAWSLDLEATLAQPAARSHLDRRRHRHVVGRPWPAARLARNADGAEGLAAGRAHPDMVEA